MMAGLVKQSGKPLPSTNPCTTRINHEDEQVDWKEFKISHWYIVISSHGQTHIWVSQEILYFSYAEQNQKYLHAVHVAVLGPPSERLAVVVEDDAAQAPKKDERAVGHDGRNVSRLLNPWRDELGETVSPDVLIDRDGYHERAGNGLVRVDGVGVDDTGQSGDLNASACVSDYNDWGPVPLVLHADGHDNVSWRRGSVMFQCVGCTGHVPIYIMTT